MRVHADTMRNKRRVLAEECAAKIGLKLLFPLIFCIFPTLLMVLLGPAGIQIASHLKRFWAPRMRQQLFAHIDAEDGAGLAPLVLEAIALHRGERATPPPPGSDAG